LQHRHLDRTIGGYHFHARAPWRWDPATGQLWPPHAQ
jgi:hypothetical protein